MLNHIIKINNNQIYPIMLKNNKLKSIPLILKMLLMIPILIISPKIKSKKLKMGN
jgi:hypothetical protein